MHIVLETIYEKSLYITNITLDFLNKFGRKLLKFFIVSFIS